MNVTNIIKGVVNATRYTVTASIIKEDYGLYLKIEGLDLPAVYEVDFSNSENSGSSVTMVGNADGVLIPRQLIKSGKDVFAFLYWNGEDFGRTVYKFRIPNKLRPDRTEEQPTPEEQSLIDQAISALNSAVEQTAADVDTTTAKAAESTAAAQTATQKASEATESAQSAGAYATRAETAQRAAESARDTATAKASAAATSADNASLSAVNALDSASDAAISAGQASASAIAAGQSAIDARNYKDAANLSAESASGYAGAASESATSASASATTATNKASEAAQSATDASTAKDDAVTAKTAAETAQTAAETAQGLAEDAQTGAETAQAAAEAAVYAKADGIVDTASGAVASFPDGADDFPMKSLKVAIDPVQDLSHGDPSPDNICPISGWTEAQVVVSPTQDAQDGTTYSVSWETEAGTVYGGTLDVVTGKLVIEWGRCNLGTLNWTYDSTYERFTCNGFYALGPYRPANNDTVALMLCDKYATRTDNNTASSTYNNSIGLSATRVLHIKDTSYNDKDAFKASLSGTYLVFKLLEPTTINLTPTEVRTLLGQNNVWADTGDSTVEYYADTKRYIDKKIAEIVN